MALKNGNDTELITYESYALVSQNDIVDIMSCALESGGIAYWCDNAEPVEGRYYGENACEHIALGGKLNIHFAEGSVEEGGSDTYVLTRNKLLHGISEYLSGSPAGVLYDDGNEIRLDTSEMDAAVCDSIIQYALFDEIVFA